MADEKQTTEKRIGTGKAGPGRKKGVPNKNTTQLKEALLEAATVAGGNEGLVGYLTQQAKLNPGLFMGLLGKVLPLQVQGDPENPLAMITRVELIAPKHGDSAG